MSSYKYVAFARCNFINLYGNYLEDVISHINGAIVYVIATPLTNKGELLFNLEELPIEFDSNNIKQ